MNPRAENSYDFVRFCAAGAVLFSHHFDLAGFSEPAVPGSAEDFGQLGVAVFFSLSGFLICRSLQRCDDWAMFVAARVLRIFPNLLFVLVATSALSLLWYGNYANLSSHVDYVGDNLLMFVKGVTFRIPGIFADATTPVVNEPLWTLPYELLLYVVLLLIVLLAGRRGGLYAALGLLAAGIGWNIVSAHGNFEFGWLESEELLRLGSFFLAGAVLGFVWDRLKRHALPIGVAGLAGLVVLHTLALQEPLFAAFALAAATVGLGSSPALAAFSKGGDASYGIYVMAWPVQQVCLLLIGDFWVSMLTAFVVSVLLGYATWHGFEKRAMAWRGAFAQTLRLGRPQPA